jgi:hypothetical protein
MTQSELDRLWELYDSEDTTNEHSGANHSWSEILDRYNLEPKPLIIKPTKKKVIKGRDTSKGKYFVLVRVQGGFRNFYTNTLSVPQVNKSGSIKISNSDSYRITDTRTGLEVKSNRWRD